MSAARSNILLPVAVNAGLLICFGMLIMFHIKTFPLWSQITDLINMCGIDPVDQFGMNPFDIMRLHHPHALRYLAIWPVVAVGFITGANMSIIFSWAVLGMLFCTSYMLAKTLHLLRPNDTYGIYRDTACFLTIWLAISLLMNGRLALTFMGISLILYAQIYYMVKHKYQPALVVLQLLGLLLCSVSSGTFMVAVAFVVTFFLTLPLTHHAVRRWIRRDSVIYGALIAFLTAPFLYQYITKNMLFYHNSLSQMLLHGPPKLLYERGVSMELLEMLCYPLALIIFIVMVLTYLSRPPQQRMFSPLILLCGFSLIIGMFGYSALLTMLPGLLLMAGYYVRYPY